MLAMALFATLATAPAPSASLPRIPGTRLRLGMTEAQVLAVGSFITVAATEPGSTSRKGPARFFGVPGEATVVLREGLLSEVHFEASGVGPHSQDYVDDELRRLQLERECEPDRPGARTCDWTSPTVRVHVEMKQDHLAARATAWPPAPAPAPATASGTGAAGATPVTNATGAGAAGATPGTGATRAGAAAGGTATGGAAGDAAAGAAAGAAAAGAAAAKVGAAPVATPVTTLPDTFTISIANRKNQAWPNIVSSPPLQYPDKAKQESLQGLVWVRALVDPAGGVLETSIERGIAELNDAALAWVLGSQFTPCEKNGAPCRYVVRVAVLFTLY